ncbi:hypothetical protein OUZ56_021051 [Daphnia magna]|uniref:Uncharacterized protein n=1 Tax=Daphnia magna TaxID=35525 RepID=A0ABQ9ZG98_9CRUS|nr:hypothetical protein OUZ56_021051 [Daphnia magna]
MEKTKMLKQPAVMFLKCLFLSGEPKILAVTAPGSIYQAVPRKLLSYISVSFSRVGMPVTVRFLPGLIEHCCEVKFLVANTNIDKIEACSET